MQKDDILEVLQEIDTYLKEKQGSRISGEKLELKILGKSALLLAGLSDSLGTGDIDLVRITASSPNKEWVATLEKEFGRPSVLIRGYYLEFISPTFAFLSNTPDWIPVGVEHECISVFYLDPHHVIASKLFSAHADIPRKRDRQDIVSALDQELVGFSKVCSIADQIFELYRHEARSDRFPEVHEYITELMQDYGKVELNYDPEE